jgi:hypothetical protein
MSGAFSGDFLKEGVACVLVYSERNLLSLQEIAQGGTVPRWSQKSWRLRQTRCGKVKVTDLS